MKTPPISTYIYCLAAGGYVGDNNQYDESNPESHSLSVYCRKSKIKCLDAKNTINIIEHSIKFFEDFF